ncbi:MAG: HAMP domain-containing sensor histidine kinase [Aquihabitans sp.]
MRRRLTVAIVAVTVLVVVLFGVPLGVVVSRLVDEQSALRLERHAVLASRQVPVDFATNHDPVELPRTDGVTFGLYDRRGRRVAGTGPRRADSVVVAALNNEVRQAEVGETRVAAIPIVDREAVIGVTRASQPTTIADRRAQHAILLLGALGLGVIAIGAGLARLLAGRIAAPIRRLRDDAVRLGNGDFAITPVPTGIVEVDDAGMALASTSHRLEDLISRERAFSADASHQLRTPLAALKTNIEGEIQFPRVASDAVLHEALEDITRLETTIDQLLAFARTSMVSADTVEIGPLLDRVRDQWNGILAQAGRPLVVGLPDETVAVATDALLHQTIDILLDNALQHGAGEVRISTRITTKSVTIAVTDRGPGFGDGWDAEVDDLGREAGAPGEGHGLGLPLARRLVEAMHGRLVIARHGPQPIIEIVLARAPDPRADGRSAS